MRVRYPCVRCELHKTCKTVKVEGDGPRDARVLFVGEAPGEQEDQQGIPFVGESGQLLRAAIKDAGIESFRITNAVRCRPVNNDRPTPKQVQACASWLDEEIRDVNPELIVALGDVALRRLTGLSGVVSKSGEVLSHNGSGRSIPVLVAVHPAFVLRKPEWLPAFQGHVRSAKKLLEGGTAPPVDYELVDQCRVGSTLASISLSTRPVSFDYETTSLDPFHGKPICAAISLEHGGGLCFDLSTDEAKKAWKAFLRSSCPKVVHNGAFEAIWSRVHFQTWPQAIVWDTMIAAHTIDENASKALKDLLLLHTDMGAYASEARTRILRDGPEALSIAELWKYNCGDADGTLRLKEVQEPLVDRRLVEWSLRYDQMLARMRFRGVPIITDEIPAAIEKVNREKSDVRNKILDYSVAQNLHLERLKEDPQGLNLGSPDQVRELLFERFGLKTSRYHKSKKTGEPSTGKDFLKEAKAQHPVIPLLIEWKRLEQLRKNFLVPLREAATEGYVHPEWNATGTRTWRLSCSSPNLQNIPKDDFVRGLFRTPKGFTFVTADFSQIELRVLAALSGEPSLLTAFEAKQDVHTRTASELFNVSLGSVSPRQRELAKRVNFGIIYGISAHGLRQKFGIEEDEGERLLERFAMAMPKVTKWVEAQKVQAEKTERVRSPFGRIRHLSLFGLSDKDVEHALRQAGNFPIQSAAGEITLRAMLEIEKHVSKGDLIVQVHDAVMLVCKEKDAKAVGDDLQRVMCGMDWSWFHVPLEVKVEIGNSWGAMETLKGDADEEANGGE